MCVIIVKKKGVSLPSRSLLRQAAAVNHDGCGFATSSGTYFRTLNFTEFYNALTRLAKVEDDVVIHFRWATHGSVKATNCHPFRGNVNGEPVYFAHNGVLPIASENDKTDSEIEFRKYILPALNMEGGFTPAVMAFLNEEAEGSRFAFVDKSGLHLVGNFIKYHGLLLSNLNFLGMSYYRTSRYSGKLAGVGL